MRFKIFLAGVLTLISALNVNAQSRQPQAEMLYSSLKPGMSAKDSINVLFDVYDLADQSKKGKYGWEILGVAERAKDYDVLYDMIPQMSTLLLSKLDEQEKLLKVARRLPAGDARKAVECYIQINQVVTEGSYLSPEERQTRLLEYLKEDATPKDDIYQNFLDLYKVVVFLGVSHDGNMYLEYLQRLENMIGKVPETGHAFPSRFYTTAANYYTRTGMAEKAIEMDRKVLELITYLEKKYASEGRKYRNYDRFKYISYRRMLSNYSVLSDKEIDELYAKCKELADNNNEIHRDFYQGRMADAYYFMAKGRYAEALPAIQAALKEVKVHYNRYWLLSSLKTAADSVGNQEVLIGALKEYARNLEEKMKSDAESTMLELKMRYEVRKIEEGRRQAEAEKHALELESDEKLISLALIAVFVLAVVLMFLYRSHFSLIHKSRDLKAENQKLHDRIEEILYNGTIPGSEDLHSQQEKPSDDNQK